MFVASPGARDEPGALDPDWLGAPMYFSHFDAATNGRHVEGADLRLLASHEETADEDGRPATFPWVVAKRP